MDKKSTMFSLVSQWRKSGLTRTVFAKQHGLELPSFDYWCKKQYNEVEKVVSSTPQFVEITPNEVNLNPISTSNINHPERLPQIELNLPSGLRIKIY